MVGLDAEIIKIVDTPTLRISVRSDGILVVIPIPNSISTVAAAKETFQIIEELSGQRGALILNDTRTHITMSADKDVRDYMTSDEVARRIRAFAILTNSPVTKLFGTLWMRISKPAFSARIFTSEEDALQWLLTFSE